jgi:signal transduction histidine kinase
MHITGEYKYYKKIIQMLICIKFILLPLNSNSQINVGHPDYVVYSDQEFINNNQVYCIKEGPQDLIYITNNLGIHEYDGVNWRKLNTGDYGGRIYSFDIDKDTGSIYFGKSGELAYLQPDKNGQRKYHSINDEVDKNLGKFSDVWNTRIINHFVYFQSYKKLFRFNIDTKKIKIWNSDTFFSLTGVIDNQFYIGQNKKGLYKVVDDSLSLISNHEKLREMLFYNIIPVNKTHILITSTDKAIFLKRETYEPDLKMNKFLQKLNPVLKNKTYNISKLQDNRYAFSTCYNGVYILDSLFNIKSIYNRDDGLPTNYTWSVNQCENGAILVGLDNGLTIIKSEKHFIYFDKNTLLNNRIMSLLRYGDFMYTGTNEGLYKLNISDIDNISIETTNIKAPIWNMKKFKNSKKDTSILIASTEGVWEQRTNTIKQIVKQEGVTNILISKIKPNRLYYCYNRGISYVENLNNSWSTPLKISNLKMSSNLIEDKYGNLWVCSATQCAYLLSQDSMANGYLYTQEILLEPSDLSITDGFLVDNKLTLVTSKGFYSFNKDRNLLLPDSLFLDNNKDSLIPNRVLRVNENEFWLSAYDNESSYLLHYSREGSSFKKNKKVLPFFKNKYITQIYSESDDRLWLGLNGKLLLVKNLNIFEPDSNKFNVLIRKVNLNNDSVLFHGTDFTKQKRRNNIYKEITKNEAIAYEFNNISFEFGAPYFDKEWLNQYSYMLEGYENNWSEWSTEAKKEYTNLHEGHYTFKVKARNIYNTESDHYHYHFTIQPPYYRSLFAYLIYAFITVSTLSLAVCHFKNKYKLEKKKLEIIINQGTSKILSQKGKIENQNKLLGSANRELHKLSIVASKVSNPVIICNPLGVIEWVNDSYCTYFGKTQEEMINGHYNLLNICFNPNIKTHFNTCVNERRAVTYTVNASKLATNRSVWMQTTLNPIVNDFGELINIIAISSDITYLHELNNTRDMVLSVITHDLKSPLLAFKLITGNSLKQLQEVKYENLKKNLSELHTHSTEMYEFLKYLSDWLKSQRGSLVFVPHVFDLSIILKDVLSLFNMNVNQKKLRIENQIPDSTEVFADKDMIKTVLRNLISNAIKFSKHGDIVTISLEKSKDNVIIAVSDNGIGISEDQRDKIFSVNENKGLGLIICKEFVQKNNGEIWIEDKEQGALVKFTVPNCKLAESYV